MKSLIFASILLVASPSFAAADFSKVTLACKPDVEKFCKGVQMGEGRIIECLKKHKDEVSPACKTAAEEKREEVKENFKKKRAEIREACETDFELHCKGIHGPRNRLNCLKEHKTQISNACRETLPN